MTNRVHQIAAKVAPILKEKDPSLARQQEQAVESFANAILLRAVSIDSQIETPIVPVNFDQAGRAAITEWSAKSKFGKPELSREGDILKARTTQGSSIGTWTARVWLDPGKYRVEASVKTAGIVPDIGDSRAGAGLRVARDRSEKFLLANTDWTTVTHAFAVQGSLSQIQILCEFRGAEGEASFRDVRLVRVSSETE
jgi:hypothetical protein